jgi:hypothetical protein
MVTQFQEKLIKFTNRNFSQREIERITHTPLRSLVNASGETF